MKRVLALLAILISVARAQNVTYHGGDVITMGARVYAIWYGPTADADKAAMRNFIRGLGGSAYLSGLMGYKDGLGRYVANVSALLGEHEAEVAYGTAPTGVDQIDIVLDAITLESWSCDQQAVYAILTGTGITGGGHHLQPARCADGTRIAIVYSSANSIPVFSHELVEAITDPTVITAGSVFLTGWWRDSDNLEIADVCSSYSDAVLTTGTFRVANYVTAGGGCNGGSSGGGGSGGGGPPPICPPGTRPIGKSGKCR